MGIIKTIVGIPILVFIFFLWGGEDGFGFLFLTIICTLGISLVVYLPVCYILGSLAFFMFGYGKNKFTEKNTNTINKEAYNWSYREMINNQNLAIINYIKQAIEYGLSNEQIKQRLKEKGWSDIVINKAFEDYLKR